MNATPARCQRARAARRRQRGVAIIMSLGILALLMVLAIGFVFTSRTERNAAAANTDQITARHFAEHSVQACMGGVKYFYQYAGSANYNTAGAKVGLYPAASAPQPAGTAATTTPFMQMASGPWMGRCYAAALTNGYPTDSLDSALSLALRDSSGSTAPTAYVAPPVTPDRITWLPMHTTIGGVGGYLFGRVAYMMIDESGKLDPNVRVSAFPTSVMMAGTPGVRVGTSPREIDVNKAVQDFASFDFTASIPWTSWQHIYANAAAAAKNSMTILADKSDYSVRRTNETVFDVLFPYSYDIEAFYGTRGNPGAIPSTATDATNNGTDFHRFNLARTDWSTMTLATLLDTTKVREFWDTTQSPPVPSTAGTTDCIPWLALVKGDTGDAAKDTILRNQVAANIIDYCNVKTNAATSDYAAAGGAPKDAGYTPASATYVGLKKSPYISKVAMTWTMTRGAGAGLPPKYPYTLTLSMDVEVVNIYSAASDPCTVDVDLTFTGGMPTAAQAPAGVIVNPSATASTSGARLSFNFGSVAAKGYSKLTQTVTYTWNSIAITPPAVNVSYIGAVLKQGGVLKDFSEISRNATTPPSFTIALAVPATGWFGTYDPRCNTAQTEWLWTAGAAAPATGNGGMSNPSAAGATCDTETATDPTGLSTAYIAEQPFTSLWEIGCIHRGEKWRTLNLHPAAGHATADGSYANGDTALLDQCKISDPTSPSTGLISRGKVNPNSRSYYVWKALLDGVMVGCPYVTNTGGTAVDMAVAWPLIQAHNIASGTVFAGRGETGELLATLTPAATTDAAKEELAGKLCNLLTTRQNYFTIIVTGQSTRDLRGVTVAGDPTVLSGSLGPWTTFRVRGEQKIVAIIYRDAYTNKYRVERLYYVDE